jgi:hypothetical protein
MKSIITVLLTVLLVMTAFVIHPALPAYAAAPPASPAATVEVTGYTVTDSATGQPVVGSIVKGQLVNVTIYILDPDITTPALARTPRAALNTASFSLGGSDDLQIIYDPSAATAEGWRYTVAFRTAVYTGTGNAFDFDIWYDGSNLAKRPVSLILNQCVPAAETKPEDVVTKGTGFVLKDARYADGQTVYAGEAFTLSATILATNGDVPVENVTVSFAPPEKLTLAEGSSIAYVGTMKPEQSVPVSVRLLPGANLEEGTYTVNIDISGINQKTGEAVTAQAKVSIPVLQPERFEIFNTQLPSDLTAGMDDGLGYAQVALVNKGKGVVSNVSVEIVGEGLTSDEGKQYIGNVAAGEQKSSDFNLHAETPGQIDGMVIVTYENARGEEKTLERGFAINVMEAAPPDMGPGFESEMPPEKTGPPNWLWAAIIAAAVIIAVILLVKRARRKKRTNEEEFLDEDDDDL